MPKLVQLKLAKIKYGGDSIGDDVRIEIDCLDHSFALDKQIKNGSTVAVNAEIGQFFIDQTSAQLLLNIRVIEQDLIFNDVGSKQVKLKVDVQNTSPQTNTYDIPVQELRGFLPGRATAIFTLTIEAQVSDAVSYIVYDKSGWIRGRREDTKEIIGLISHLKVLHDHSDSERQYFKIMEGILRGVKASVKIEADGTSYLQTANPHTEPARLTYSLSAKTLKFQNKIYMTRDYPDDPEPLKKGFYDIEIPDASHKGGPMG